MCFLRGTVERAADKRKNPAHPRGVELHIFVFCSSFSRSWARSHGFVLSVMHCLSSPHAGLALCLVVASGSSCTLHPGGLQLQKLALAKPGTPHPSACPGHRGYGCRFIQTAIHFK